MEIRETIRLKGTPFPAQLPAPADEFVSALRERGYTFEEMDKWSIMLNELYAPHRLGAVEKIVQEKEWNVQVEHSVWPVYDDEDYSNAPLWVLLPPEIWIDEIDFSAPCSECGKKRIKVDTDHRVPKVKSKKPIVAVNGQFHVVNVDLREAILRELTGAKCDPFDEKGHYFYLTAENDLGDLLIKEDETIGLQSPCPQCGLPRFRIFFGPLRYSEGKWTGADVAYGTFHDGNLYTPKAYELLRSFDSNISKDGIALLE